MSWNSHLDVWGGDVDLSVEPSRSEEGSVQDVQPVGGGQHDDVGLPRVEAVHLDQQLVQRVLHLRLTADAAAAYISNKETTLEREVGKVPSLYLGKIPAPSKVGKWFCLFSRLYLSS